jgi:hypothetical protein
MEIMTPKEMRATIIGFEVMRKVTESVDSCINMSPDIINGALRLSSRIISPKVMQDWMQHCWVYLDSSHLVMTQKQKCDAAPLKYSDLNL